MTWHNQPIEAVRIVKNEEEGHVTMYLDMYNEDPAKQWHFAVETIIGNGRPTLTVLDSLLEMAKRKFKD